MTTLQRDRPQTTFSRLLEGFVQAHPRVLIAAFVDDVGECIDYASAVPPYDAHVLGAHLASTTAELVRTQRELFGALIAWSVTTEGKTLFVRRVTAEHCLALQVSPAPLGAAAVRALPRLVAELRDEAVLDAASWDHLGEPVTVETRPSARWDHAPQSFVESTGLRRKVEIIGRFDEGGGAWLPRTTCYRVRVEPGAGRAGGTELTLAHAAGEGRWYRR